MRRKSNTTGGNPKADIAESRHGHYLKLMEILDVIRTWCYRLTALSAMAALIIVVATAANVQMSLGLAVIFIVLVCILGLTATALDGLAAHRRREPDNSKEVRPS